MKGRFIRKESVLLGPYGLVTADISNLLNRPSFQCILKQKRHRNVRFDNFVTSSS